MIIQEYETHEKLQEMKSINKEMKSINKEMESINKEIYFNITLIIFHSL